MIVATYEETLLTDGQTVLHDVVLAWGDKELYINCRNQPHAKELLNALHEHTTAVITY